NMAPVDRMPVKGDAGVEPREHSADLLGVIGRCVINDQNANGNAFLGQNAFDAFGKEVSVAITWNDDVDRVHFRDPRLEGFKYSGSIHIDVEYPREAFGDGILSKVLRPIRLLAWAAPRGGLHSSPIRWTGIACELPGESDVQDGVRKGLAGIRPGDHLA